MVPCDMTTAWACAMHRHPAGPWPAEFFAWLALLARWLPAPWPLAAACPAGLLPCRPAGPVKDPIELPAPRPVPEWQEDGRKLAEQQVKEAKEKGTPVGGRLGLGDQGVPVACRTCTVWSGMPGAPGGRRAGVAPGVLWMAHGDCAGGLVGLCLPAAGAACPACSATPGSRTATRLPACPQLGKKQDVDMYIIPYASGGCREGLGRPGVVATFS